MDCPGCQSDIPGDSRFCAYCGITVPRCIPCGFLHPVDAVFCPKCGEPTARKSSRSLFPDPESDFSVEDEKWHLRDREGIYGFIYEPDFPERRQYLSEGDITIGAGNKNDIVIDKPAISWNHSLLICRHDKVRIQDSASTNGTFVNDVRLSRPKQLFHGDAVRFANVEFRLWIKPQLRNKHDE